MLKIEIKIAFNTAQKMKFSIKNFFSKCSHNWQETADLVAFTEENLNGKLHFLCSVMKMLLSLF